MIPRYSICGCSKTHLDGFRKYDSSSSRSSTSWTICRCRGRFSLVAMSISSIYTKSSVGYLLVRHRNMQFIAQENVAGELVSPKNITRGWNKPKGVLKAAAHWSSSQMQILLY